MKKVQERISQSIVMWLLEVCSSSSNHGQRRDSFATTIIARVDKFHSFKQSSFWWVKTDDEETDDEETDAFQELLEVRSSIR